MSVKSLHPKVDCQGFVAIWQLAVDMRAKGLLQPAFLHHLAPRVLSSYRPM